MKWLIRYWWGHDLLPIIVYIIGLGILLRYALGNYSVTSDNLDEYKFYIMTVKNGGYQHLASYIISSSLFATTIPAHIQRITHLDILLVFKIFPQLFYALMPMFVYLIARRYTERIYAFVASLLPMASVFFTFYPAIGRWGVGLGFATGLVWAIMEKRWIWSAVFSVCLIFAHYATTYIVMGVILFMIVVLLLWRRWRAETLRIGAMVLVLMLITSYAWYVVIQQDVWLVTRHVIGRFINEVEMEKEITANIPVIDMPSGIPSDAAERWKYLSDKVGGRDPVLAVALGYALPWMNVPQKVEWALSWIIALSVSSGLIICIVKRKFPLELSAISVALSGMVMVAVVSPYISIIYGLIRTYHTASIVLPVSYAVGTGVVSRSKISIVVALMVVVLYGLCTSGVIHLMFGIQK